jgi:hypothetical protein
MYAADAPTAVIHEALLTLHVPVLPLQCQSATAAQPKLTQRPM